MQELTLNYKDISYFLAYCGDSNPAHSDPKHVKKIVNELSQTHSYLIEEFESYNENAVIVPGIYLAQHIEDLVDAAVKPKFVVSKHKPNFVLPEIEEYKPLITGIDIYFKSPLLIKKESDAEKKVYRSLVCENDSSCFFEMRENSRMLMSAEISLSRAGYFDTKTYEIYKSLLTNINAKHFAEKIRDNDAVVYENSLSRHKNSIKPHYRGNIPDITHFMAASYIPKHLLKFGKKDTMKIYMKQTLKFDRTKYPTKHQTIRIALKNSKTNIFKFNIAAENSMGVPFMVGVATVLEKEFTR